MRLRQLTLGLIVGVSLAFMASRGEYRQVNPIKDVRVNTVTLTVPISYMFGTVVTNAGDANGAILNLPAASKGYHITATLFEAQDVDFNPQDADRIIGTNALGDAISSDATAGSSLTLVADSDSTWVQTAKIGTWTDVN